MILHFFFFFCFFHLVPLVTHQQGTGGCKLFFLAFFFDALQQLSYSGNPFILNHYDFVCVVTLIFHKSIIRDNQIQMHLSCDCCLMTDEIWKKVKFNLFWSYMRDLLIRVEYLYLFFKEILRVLLHVFLTYFESWSWFTSECSTLSTVCFGYTDTRCWWKSFLKLLKSYILFRLTLSFWTPLAFVQLMT